MKRKVVIFALGIALINALTLVTFASSETSTGNTGTSEYEKAFDPDSMNLSENLERIFMSILREPG